MMSEELLPCPFCGGKDNIACIPRYDHFMLVHRCAITNGLFSWVNFRHENENGLIQLWNTRAGVKSD